MFLSIFAATCRPDNIVPFFNNLADTCDDPSSFEVLIKLDDGADELIQLIENYKKTAKFSIKYLATQKLDGYYSLDAGYNELLKITHPDTYFCWLLTDEIRFETKGWDSTLKKYIGFYPDDIFRIKLSIFELKNYYHFFECFPCPDNYAVTTRKWLEITGGWGDFWGPDSWHQCVDYYLGLCKNFSNPYGVWRSIPVFDIKVGGQEAGQGVKDRKKLDERADRIWLGWRKHSTFKAQENFFKLAQRLNLHICARNLQLDEYILQEDPDLKTIKLYSPHRKRPYLTYSYKIPLFKLMIGNKTLNPWHFVPFLYLQRKKVRRVIRFVSRKIKVVFFKQLSIDQYRSTRKSWRKTKKSIKSSPERLFILLKKTLARCVNTILMRPTKTRPEVTYRYDGSKLTTFSQDPIVKHENL